MTEAEPGDSLWLKLQTPIKLVLVFVVLDCFLVSIGLLGAFRSMGRGHFEAMIAELAMNPFLGLLIGILATSIFQSSSTTTSLVVGLVGANFLNLSLDDTLRAVVPIVMGANIGTSVTNTLVSIGHISSKREFFRAFSAATVHDMFNFLCVLIFLPLQAATNFIGKSAIWLAQAFEHTGGLKMGSPLKMLLKPQIKVIKGWYDEPFVVQLTILFLVAFLAIMISHWLVQRFRRPIGVTGAHVLFSGLIALLVALLFQAKHVVFQKEIGVLMLALGAMFSSLYFLVKLMKSLVLSRMEVLFHRYIFKTALRSLVMGWALTVMVQSSSITTSLVVPLAGAGILNVYQIFPFTLGANVGTTVTAILAALSTGQISAIAVAFSHLLFNIFGLLIFYFKPMRFIPIAMSQRLSLLAVKRPYLPFAYIFFVFFVIPVACIYLF